ncbi:MAG TPA: histidine kinase N-terminal 7TM domain-containing protein, partial [Spirochaetia bacterium]|nr:histidine kinase N-terminal 7TM domain-containing protein [Spirochaetia bacterium]
MGEVPIVISTLVYSLPWVTAAYLAVGVRMAVQGGGKEFHPFSLVMGAAALYSFGYFLELQASNLETLVLVRDFELAGAISLPAVTFLFLADLAGVRVGPGAKAGLAAISLVLWLFLVSNPLHGLFYPQVGIRFGAFTVPVTVKGPVYFLFLAWVGIFLVGSTFLLIRSFRRTKDPRRRRTLRFVLVALQILWVPVVLILAGLDTVLDPVPPTILVLCLHFLAHEVRHDLFEIQVRRWRQAFLGVEEAAFLTDGTRTVVGANAPADRILTALGLGPQVSTLPP